MKVKKILQSMYMYNAVVREFFASTFWITLCDQSLRCARIFCINILNHTLWSIIKMYKPCPYPDQWSPAFIYQFLVGISSICFGILSIYFGVLQCSVKAGTNWDVTDRFYFCDMIFCWRWDSYICINGYVDSYNIEVWRYYFYSVLVELSCWHCHSVLRFNIYRDPIGMLWHNALILAAHAFASLVQLQYSNRI